MSIKVERVRGGYVFKIGELSIYAEHDSKNHKWHFCRVENEWNYWRDADGSNVILTISEKKGESIIDFLKILSKIPGNSEENLDRDHSENSFDSQGEKEEEDFLDMDRDEDFCDEDPDDEEILDTAVRAALDPIFDFDNLEAGKLLWEEVLP